MLTVEQSWEIIVNCGHDKRNLKIRNSTHKFEFVFTEFEIRVKRSAIRQSICKEQERGRSLIRHQRLDEVSMEH